jgi:hypothetical protein
LFEVALAARVPAGIAWLYPLITDGLALVAYAATARLTGGATRYAWSVVVLAAGLSGLAQASYLAGGATLDAPPALRFGVGAWPAVAAAVVAHLLYLLAADPVAAAHHVDAHDDKQPVSEQPSIPCPDPVSPPSSAGRGPEWVDPGGEESDPTAGRPTPVTMRRADVEPAEPAGLVAPGPSASPAVQPGVQPAVYGTEPVQPALYNTVTAELAARAATADDQPSAPTNAGDEHRSGPVEHHADAGLNTAAATPPRDRARAAAMRHAARHGALPTVSELEGLAEVSRGTAAAALRALRDHPTPLHLVPDTPEPETQP